MNITTEADLARLCDILRAKGVKSFTVDGVHVEFGPTADATPESKPAADPDICRCGHAGHQHVAGLCVLGCDVEKCAGSEVAS